MQKWIRLYLESASSGHSRNCIFGTSELASCFFLGSCCLKYTQRLLLGFGSELLQHLRGRPSLGTQTMHSHQKAERSSVQTTIHTSKQHGSTQPSARTCYWVSQMYKLRCANEPQTHWHALTLFQKKRLKARLERGAERGDRDLYCYVWTKKRQGWRPQNIIPDVRYRCGSRDWYILQNREHQ